MDQGMRLATVELGAEQQTTRARQRSKANGRVRSRRRPRVSAQLIGLVLEQMLDLSVPLCVAT